jgi:membrane-bound serine protease (ClpP class)
MRRLRWFPILIGLILLFFQSAQAQNAAHLVLVLKANGEVAPAMQEYIQRGIQLAEQRQAELLVIELNTPGGAIQNMTTIVTAIRASTVPVVVYITPRGAMAASAGTLITLAGHAAAMAPETIIGAASPINSTGQDLSSTEKAKSEEALKALVRSIAAHRSPPAIQLAESTIDSAKAVSADEAKSVGLVDFIATDLNDLLRQLDGFTVQMPKTEAADTLYTPLTLHTAGAIPQDLPMSFIEQLLDILVNPNIVFLLIAVGIQAILIELSNPGGWIPGFIGVISLALAAYGMGVLSVNWFGLVFLLLAFGLFILDVHALTHGALTAAGIGSFIVGALVLFNSPGTPQFQQVSLPLVVVTGVIFGLSFALILAMALRAQKTPLRIGPDMLIGQQGTAKGKIDPHGQVQLKSELWSAELAEGAVPIQSDEKVEVVAVAGLRLKVRKQN